MKKIICILFSMIIFISSIFALDIINEKSVIVRQKPHSSIYYSRLLKTECLVLFFDRENKVPLSSGKFLTVADRCNQNDLDKGKYEYISKDFELIYCTEGILDIFTRTGADYFQFIKKSGIYREMNIVLKLKPEIGLNDTVIKLTYTIKENEDYVGENDSQKEAINQISDENEADLKDEPSSENEDYEVSEE